MARYEAGETLASIARTYDCSPPAISYVVSRSRARVPGTEAAAKPPSATEPQLIKTVASEAAAPGSGKPQTPNVSGSDVHTASWANGPNQSGAETQTARPEARDPVPSDRRDQNPRREANGFVSDGAAGASANPVSPVMSLTPRPAAPAHTNGTDQRRTLHLSLGNTGSANGAAEPNRSQPPQPNPTTPPNGGDAAGSPGFSEIRPVFDEPIRRSDANVAPRKDAGGSFIDQELRARVDTDIAAFLAAFDAALLQDSQESRSALREATDRLLRAGARTRIELERLEARIPLPPRDAGGSSERAWRYR